MDVIKVQTDILAHHLLHEYNYLMSLYVHVILECQAVVRAAY